MHAITSSEPSLHALPALLSVRRLLSRPCRMITTRMGINMQYPNQDGAAGIQINIPEWVTTPVALFDSIGVCNSCNITCFSFVAACSNILLVLFNCMWTSWLFIYLVIFNSTTNRWLFWISLLHCNYSSLLHSCIIKVLGVCMCGYKSECPVNDCWVNRLINRNTGTHFDILFWLGDKCHLIPASVLASYNFMC